MYFHPSFVLVAFIIFLQCQQGRSLSAGKCVALLKTQTSGLFSQHVAFMFNPSNAQLTDTSFKCPRQTAG